MGGEERQGQQVPSDGGATMWPLAGIASLGLAMVASGVLFFYLPPGRYPYLLVGLPAIPFIYLALWCFKRDGIVRERRIAENKKNR